MKKRVLCELPDALLERLLALLPVSSLLRFRCVCKSWNSFILSSDFLHLCSATSTSPHACSHGGLDRGHDESSYLLISTWSCEYPLLAFNPSRQTWHLPSADSLLKQSDLAAAGLKLSVVAAAGGLLCLSDGASKLVVCNPVTRKVRQIDRTLDNGEEFREKVLREPAMASMRYDEEERSYALVVVGTCEGEEVGQVTCVYDSRRHVWRREKQREALVFESGGVFVGEDLYVVTSFPARLMVLSTGTAAWRDEGVGLPAGVRYPSLVEVGGEVVLLAAVGGRAGDKLAGYRVWRLLRPPQRQQQAWQEVARMPDAIFRQIAMKEMEGFEGLSCVAVRHSIYMIASEGCLLLDMALLTWHCLPHSPILGGLLACIKDIYAMHPRLHDVS